MFITVAAQKGAQAKTSTAVNLAAALAVTQRGLVVDVDTQQCDATRYSGSIEGVEWAGELPKKARSGFTVVDTPPQIVPAIGAAFLLSDLVVIPCTPQGASLESLARTFETVELARAKNPRLTAIVVFTCIAHSRYHEGIIAAARVLSQWPVAKTFIPSREKDFETAYAARRPVVLNAPKSVGALAYRALADEIHTILGK